MIVKRKMVNIKLKRHTMVQRWWYHHQSSVPSVPVSPLSGDCSVF